MSTPLVATHTQERRRLSPLYMVMIAGLIGNILVNIVLQVLIVRELIVPLSIILALTLVIAGIVAVGYAAGIGRLRNITKVMIAKTTIKTTNRASVAAAMKFSTTAIVTSRGARP